MLLLVSRYICSGVIRIVIVDSLQAQSLMCFYGQLRILTSYVYVSVICTHVM